MEALILKLKLRYFGQLMQRAESLENTLPDAGKGCWQEEKGVTEDEMVGWHPWLNGHEFEQTPGDGEGQGTLMCCSPWDFKEADTTEQLKSNNRVTFLPFSPSFQSRCHIIPKF